MCASLVPYCIHYCWYEVGVLKVLEHNIGEKPTVILYNYINRHAGIPKQRQKPTINLDTTQFCGIMFGTGFRCLGSGSSICESESSVTFLVL